MAGVAVFNERYSQSDPYISALPAFPDRKQRLRFGVRSHKAHYGRASRCSYFHIVRILDFTSIGARADLAVSVLDLICGQDRLWKYPVTFLGMKRVRWA